MVGGSLPISATCPPSREDLFLGSTSPTDCTSFTWLLIQLEGQLAWWLEALQNYNFEICRRAAATLVVGELQTQITIIPHPRILSFPNANCFRTALWP